MQWTDRRMDWGGVLSPDVDGLRQLYNVKEKKTIPWQKSESDHPDDIIIGRFVFDADAFQRAMDWLDDHLKDPSLKYIILDEVGPLELSGKGWDQWLKTALPKLNNKTLILVIRDHLLKEVVVHYGLDEFEVVGKEYFLV
jgi:nucleoside-triphosphatase